VFQSPKKVFLKKKPSWPFTIFGIFMFKCCRAIAPVVQINSPKPKTPGFGINKIGKMESRSISVGEE